MVKTINGEVQLHALIDGKKIIITEASVRRDLQLADEEGVECLPYSTIFEQLTLIGKPKRKDTQVPQPNDPIKNVADEAVHKELGDSLVRAATTASSLEAEQDSGNINKTQSKATPNESSSLGTNSGGGPRCQETMGDTIAQTRFKNVSKYSNDSLLARDEEMFDVNVLDGEEMFVAEQEVVVKDVNNEVNVVEKPMKKKDLIRLDEEVSLKLQAKFNEEERLAKEKAKKEKEANISLIETWDDIQEKIDVDHQLAERLQAQEQEELSIEEKATLFQQLLEKRRKHFAAKRAEEKRNKPLTKAQ
ncbi:hypothetical protein Tco_0923033 [Tanacetum coccineum]|uniref:Uncharacterized protein n=1 Tax=Tanacetum coccineum TaxID=301880 RepID=A0ABQ5D0T5_9ASTR